MKNMVNYILSILAISVVSIALCLIMYVIYKHIIPKDIETPSRPCKILFAEHKNHKLIIRVYEVDNGKYKAVVSIN